MYREKKPNANQLMSIQVDLGFSVVNVFLKDYKNEVKYRSSIWDYKQYSVIIGGNDIKVIRYIKPLS